MHPRALSSPLPALPVPSPSHCAAFASSTATRLSQAIGLPPVVAQCPCRKHTPMCQRSRDRIPLSHPPRVPRRPVKGGTMPFARDTSGSDRCHQVPTSAGAPGSVSTPPAPHLGISRRSVTRRPPLPRFTATPPPGAHLKIVSEHSSTVLLCVGLPWYFSARPTTDAVLCFKVRIHALPAPYIHPHPRPLTTSGDTGTMRSSVLVQPVSAHNAAVVPAPITSEETNPIPRPNRATPLATRPRRAVSSCPRGHAACRATTGSTRQLPPIGCPPRRLATVPGDRVQTPTAEKYKKSRNEANLPQPNRSAPAKQHPSRTTRPTARSTSHREPVPSHPQPLPLGYPLAGGEA